MRWKHDIRLINNNKVYRSELRGKPELNLCLLRLKTPNYQTLFMSYTLRDYADFLRSFSAYDCEKVEELRAVAKVLQDVYAYAFREARIDYERVYDTNYKSSQNVRRA